VDRSWGYGSEQRNQSENQDCHGVFEFPHCALAVVCDGMGGHVGGSQASTLCVQTVHDFFAENPDMPVREALRGALELANQVIYEAARKNHRLMGMGTTAVVAVLEGDSATVAHVGDSRAYLVRSGAADAITRDHTMVNLFVDAELLTPEDAATHPEAHVLSRSIGVERSVEVDIGQPLTMREGDVVLLCTDGLHGVIADFELAEVDWNDPMNAIRELLEVVVAREGDDNTSAAALRFGTPIGAVPPTTPVPEPLKLEEILARSSQLDRGEEAELDGISTAHDEVDESEAPAEPGEPRPDEPQYVVFEEEPGPSQLEALREKVRRETPNAAEPIRQRVSIAVAALGAIAAVLLSIVAVRHFTAPDEVIEGSLEKGVEGGTVVHKPAPVLPVAPEEPVFWLPAIPPPPPRAKWQPGPSANPPRTPELINAVHDAKQGNCGASFDWVQAGMVKSPDHAPLYEVSWDCFNSKDQQVVAGTRLHHPEEVAAILPNLQGDVALRPEPAGSEALPVWARPATDGIEYRLEHWQPSTDTNAFSQVILDRLGPPAVADDLAADLVIEAQLAVALAHLPQPSPEIVNWWARRVYVLASALRGPVGELVTTHRRELPPQLESWLGEATTAASPTEPVPQEVVDALEAGRTGSVKPVAAIRDPSKPPLQPRRPQEPTDEELADPNGN
jgi:protein phosphatase